MVPVQHSAAVSVTPMRRAALALVALVAVLVTSMAAVSAPAEAAPKPTRLTLSVDSKGSGLIVWGNYAVRPTIKKLDVAAAVKKLPAKVTVTLSASTGRYTVTTAKGKKLSTGCLTIKGKTGTVANTATKTAAQVTFPAKGYWDDVKAIYKPGSTTVFDVRLEVNGKKAGSSLVTLVVTK